MRDCVINKIIQCDETVNLAYLAKYCHESISESPTRVNANFRRRSENFQFNNVLVKMVGERSEIKKTIKSISMLWYLYELGG